MHQRVDTFLQNLFEDNMQVAGHHPLLSPPGWGKDGLSEELLGAFDTQLENDDDSVELALMKLEDGLSEDLLGAFDAQLENDDSVSLSCCLRPSPLPIVLVLPRADRAPLRPGALPSIP